MGIALIGNEPATAAKFLQNPQMVLRADGAVRADRLNAALVQKRPGIPRARAAEGGSLFGIGQLRDNGQLRKRTNGFDCRQQFLGIAERLQNEKIHAAFLERLGLFAKDFPDMFRQAPRAPAGRRPSGPIDPAIRTSCLRGLARLARDFHAAMIEFGDAVFQAKRAQACCGSRQTCWFR